MHSSWARFRLRWCTTRSAVSSVVVSSSNHLENFWLVRQPATYSSFSRLSSFVSFLKSFMLPLHRSISRRDRCRHACLLGASKGVTRLCKTAAGLVHLRPPASVQCSPRDRIASRIARTRKNTCSFCPFPRQSRPLRKPPSRSSCKCRVSGICG